MAEKESPVKKEGPALPEPSEIKDVEVAPEMKELENGKPSAKVLRSLTYAGPLPTPEMMRQYDMVLKGSADRILRMAEEDSRRDTMIVETEKSRIEKSLAIESMSQVFLFILLIALVASSFFFFYMGNPKAGAAFRVFPVLKEARALFSKVSGGDAKKD